MPKGRCLNQYLLNVVMNVVNREELGVSGTCQKPELASNFVKCFAPAS